MTRSRVSLAALLLAGLAGLTPVCGLSADPEPASSPNQETPDVQAQVAALLDQYQNDLARLEIAMNLAAWKAANTGEKADFDVAAQTELALRTFHSNPAAYQRIVQLSARAAELSPEMARALELARLAYQANQLPAESLERMVELATEIQRTFNTFRGKLEGREYTNNDLLEMLGDEKDSARRQAMWEALKQVGEAVAPKLIELAHVRNDAARKLGFANYWEMQILLQEHDPEQLMQLFAELAEKTDRPFTAMKEKMDRELAQRFGVTPETMMPWHYDNPFFQAAPPSADVDLDVFYESRTKEEIVELARKYYAEVGLPVEGILARSDLYERPGKDQHAFCTDIDRSGDVRTLCNVKPTVEWMDTVLHELGHGVYDLGIDPALPYNVRGPAHIFTTEGVAMLMGAKAKEADWMIAHAGVPAERLAGVRQAVAEQRRAEQLIFARWTLVMLYFEKALYENPDQDLNTLWWDMVERYQKLRRPAGRNAADWASKPHFTIAPVYYHNYMMGELFAAQLRHVARQQGDDSPAALGKLLREKVFRPGSLWLWPEFVRRATGEPLTARYFAEEAAQ